ncbi:MAG: DJ-1/PfpI family protein [Ardenticatenaceae bacterium]|nr:DJ-1/PfpI family protein [Ardenticatenaceae bacterium]
MKKVAILLFEDVELLDFAGPYEVFSSVRSADGTPLMEVLSVAESTELVRCRNGLVVQPGYTLKNCPTVDIVLLPGGRGTVTAVNRPHLINWIIARSQQTELMTSVCTGSFLLAKAGLLAGKQATTYFGSIPTMRESYPDIEVLEAVRWVDAGNVITSAGVSAGIDMALHLVARLFGKPVADATARGIEYDYWA